MISDWMLLGIGADWWLAGAIILIGGAWLTLLFMQLRKAQAQIVALEDRLSEAQEQSQRDLLTLGQRVMEADKIVRRFNERLDAIQNTQPAEPRYGQLEALLKAAQNKDGGVASKAEEELLSLLRRSTQSQ